MIVMSIGSLMVVYTNGSIISRYGIGVDSKLNNSLYGDVEISMRDLDVSVDLVTDLSQTEDHKENLYRTYPYWAFHRNWAVSSEYLFEKFKLERNLPLPLSS